MKFKCSTTETHIRKSDEPSCRSHKSSFSWKVFDGSRIIFVVLTGCYYLTNRDSDRTFSYDLINLLCCCSKWPFFISIWKNVSKNIEYKDLKTAVMMSLSGLRTLRRCISLRSSRIGRTLPLLAFKNDITMRNTRTIEFASRSLSNQPYGLSQQEADSFSLLSTSYLLFLDRLAETGDIDLMIQTLKDVSVDDSSKSSFYSSHLFYLSITFTEFLSNNATVKPMQSYNSAVILLRTRYYSFY